MLCHLAQENNNKYENKVLYNALLDSYLLHARVLYAFFCTPPDERKKDPDGNIDDVSASQFFDDPTLWLEEKKNLFPKVKHLNKQIHKHLAHLTYTRVTAKHSWNITEMHMEFEEAYRLFVNLLTDERRKWFVKSA